MSINKSFQSGYLGADPVLKEAKKLNIAFFSIATTDSYRTPEGEWKEIVDWVHIKAKGKVVKYVKNLSKGDKVLVSGKIKAESWSDKESGEKKFSQYLIAKTVELLSKKPGETPPTFTVEDIPF